ncbi:sensor histidine kinase [Paractinoplanes abujensis]|uniref:Signal transduction histidine kinase n=1 Tax=Paractinoplanes abujensis TaxID=882441 RepID=A0A7W7FXH6_9ACTN|nr:sensor histidine kinase [Actinoplanes abujensis]MBB4689948.1 signal transduction histidine kinase [Actinoplanes abujensis]
MTNPGTKLDRRWELALRWHPYYLLATSVLLASSQLDLTPGTDQRLITVAVIVAAVVLQLWWDRARRFRTGPDTASATYFALRWLISAVLTALNPFFAFYVATGYIDNTVLLRGRRWQAAGTFAHSLPMAAAQAGGLPFSDTGQWIIFFGLLLANNVLLTMIAHFVQNEEERSEARAATIAELERANTALEAAIEENASLHAQLLLQAREAGVLEERRRLAAEIHDTIAQGLTGIITQLQAVIGTSDPVAAREHHDRAAELARHSLGEARRSVHNLAPLSLAHDTLPQALRSTVVQWAERHHTRAEFTLTGTVLDLPDETAAAILRITQEALANAAKHAGASRVGVTLSYMNDEVTLDIRDDGSGFDPQRLPRRDWTGGFGLEGMRTRAEQNSGSLTVESEPGYGTAVSARLPVRRQE